MAIYFLQSGMDGSVKIGYAKDVRRRVGHLQTGSPHKLFVRHVFEGDASDELALHDKFARHRQNGEWFSPVPEILSPSIDLLPCAKIGARLRNGSIQLNYDANPLRSAIHAAGYTQRTLADNLNISEPTISRWVMGGIQIPSRYLMTLAGLIGVSVEFLLQPRDGQ